MCTSLHDGEQGAERVLVRRDVQRRVAARFVAVVYEVGVRVQQRAQYATIINAIFALFTEKCLENVRGALGGGRALLHGLVQRRAALRHAQLGAVPQQRHHDARVALPFKRFITIIEKILNFFKFKSKLE